MAQPTRSLKLTIIAGLHLRRLDKMNFSLPEGRAADLMPIAKGYSGASQPFFIARLTQAEQSSSAHPRGGACCRFVISAIRLNGAGDKPRLVPNAGRGAYTIRALPDLCGGIVSERLGHLDP